MHPRHLLLALALSLLVLPALATPALATPLADGTYMLLDHPDGNAAPPLYGLRLDGLTDGDADTIHVFSFDAALGANVQMSIDGDEIHIFGTVFGGEIDDHAFAGGGSLWDLDFTYSDAAISGMTHVAHTGGGLITERGGDSYKLGAFAGSHDYAFKLAMGHRGVDDAFSGFGWLNHSGAREHLASSDWLFRVGPQVVPEASGLAFAALGIVGLIWAGRPR